MNKRATIHKHKGPIKKWHEGLMVGNGHFGALIYGEKELVFSLDLIDLWDNRKTSEMKEKGFTYQNMIHTIKNDWNEYIRLFDNCYNHPYPTKLNAGSIVFHNIIDRDDVFELNIKKAEYNISGKENNFAGYLDANFDILVIKCPQNSTFSFNMPDYFYDEEKGLGYSQPEEYTNGKFRYIIQQTKYDYSYCILTYKTNKNGEDYLLVNAFILPKKSESFEMEKRRLVQYFENLEDNLKNHHKYWDKYYKQSNIITKDKKIDRLYNFGRYFFACNSKGSYPMSLEGVWTRNDGHLPPWKGDYHLDINLQMSYESYMKTGNFAEGKVLVDYLWKNRNEFKKLARKFCNSEGYFVPGVMSQSCLPLGGWPMYALNPCNSIWICTEFDNYYRYTGKKSFLKNRAFPFIENIEKCISSLLIKDKDGHLKFEFSASPEINDCTKESIFENQSNFEIGLLRYLYRILIEYSNILQLDSRYYESQLSLISDYYRNENGELTITKDLDYRFSHRHFSHILCHKNLENFDPYQYSEQILKDFKNLQKYGTNEWVGFSFTEASSLASYIGLGEEAYKYIYAFEDGFVNKNCFHMNMDFKHKGYSTIQSYAFTLEANMGFVRAVTDMMLRTTNGIITVFPAIPEQFKKQGVSFKNLRSFNNHKVSGCYKDEKLSFDIKLSKPGTIVLYNNIGGDLNLEIDGTKQHFESKINDFIKIEADKVIKYIER